MSFKNLIIKKTICEESKCPWILEHPLFTPGFQITVLLGIVFSIGMLVGKLV